MSNPGLQYDPKSYARYRPTYAANFYDSIYATADIPDYDTALDVGTGTGQVAQVLAERFRRVIGTDISSTQLGEAVRLPNIRYLETPAETLEGVEDDSVDLITVGVAYHWFDHAKFLEACRRVLRPAGALAVWGYSYSELRPGSAASPAADAAAFARANEAFQELHNGTLGPYWESGRKFLDQRYEGVKPGPESFETCSPLTVQTMEKSYSLNDMIGYLSSWSPYHRFLRENPGGQDPLESFKAALADILSIDDADKPDTILNVWPLCGFVATKPVKS
ncbi:hypothetical protein QBZ16_001719 [Prototheca wickerhamii]|uniref:Methyltransferase type 11 domain-containing protein n=1 Tax=Prototheca wickerhamii TaxID=3111 RepID=A0AAD9IDX8_PROWI|nr:hypothetical protein QBZ16_001719 [Prototheca wickerhamii]